MKPITMEEYRRRFFDKSLPTESMERLSETEAADCRLPGRKPVSHKYSYGRALIIGGSEGFSGAPALAANACERGGAGLTHLMVPRQIYSVAAAKCDGAVVTPLRSKEDGTAHVEAVTEILPQLKKASACAVGPGLGHDQDALEIVRAVVREAACPLVLDADALTACGMDMSLLSECRAPVILTPHEGEFRRMGGDLTDGRLRGAMKFAGEHQNVILILKGYGTLICSGGEAAVNPTGSPAMAKGGSGDVLCGLLCALLAQGFDPLFSARTAVYLHGLAGDMACRELGEYCVTPSDMIRFLPAAFKRAAL